MVQKLTDPRLRESQRRIIENVERYGTHVVKVFSPDPTPTPEWAYTIGLYHTFSHPEVVVFGLPVDVAHDLLNDLSDLVREGRRFEAGTETDLLLNDLRCAFRDVRPVWHYPFVGWADWFYGDKPVPVVQMFWPDREDRFPWEPGFDAELLEKQLLLYRDDPESSRAAAYLKELEDKGLWPPRDSA